jgi:hypothetical protein
MVIGLAVVRVARAMRRVVDLNCILMFIACIAGLVDK